MIETNEQLIQELIDFGYLKNERLIDAFKNIDRKDFIQEASKDLAYINEPLAIGYNQTISQPLTVAFMLELLDLKEGDNVLEIGAGSGWQTMLIAHMISNTGNITAIEVIPEFKEMAEKNISKHVNEVFNNIKLILGDGSKGFEENSPYDKIISAATCDEIPTSWKEQLKIGGRIVTPVKNSIVVLDKTAKNDFIEKSFPGFSFVPLVIG
ncbi:MAG: protein-L-isoaspartate O-methyltransferase [Candidatus Paceibacterota bacterium]|jgi:protein-L-isoaspartate(D-aspartate) O-methyltransferase